MRDKKELTPFDLTTIDKVSKGEVFAIDQPWEGGSGGEYKLHGSRFACIKKLVALGLITPRSSPGRMDYTLTAKGKREREANQEPKIKL